eukprot:2862415-Ditylum_brightwellii.AAC.2
MAKDTKRAGGKDAGQCPLDIPEPGWLVDPTYITKNCHKTYTEVFCASCTPLEHLFNNHKYCGT